MSDLSNSINSAKVALQIEIDALNNFANNLESKIEGALKLLVEVKGRVIITGLGKSGLVGAKIAATLSSTGTPAQFIHSADALHGDSGAIQSSDLVIAISNSGETAEVVAFAEMAKQWGNKVISITSKSNSTLAKLADMNIDIAFMGVEALDPTLGAAAHHEDEARINRQLAARSNKTVIITTSSKFRERAFAVIAQTEEIDVIITDNGIDQDTYEKFKRAGVDMVVV